MKNTTTLTHKLVYTIFILCSTLAATAQNEARMGIFSGINYTNLSNNSDAEIGDYLPTFKPTIGAEAAYRFTLFKALPVGISGHVCYNQLGQNYRGLYEDSTSFYAYTRLNYVRGGLGFSFGTNVRRQVSLTFTSGATIGFMTNYQDRYELIRYNNERFIIDIKDNEALIYDTASIRGSLKAPLYNKLDMSVFNAFTLDVLLSRRIVFGLTLRYDLGIQPVETNSPNSIALDTQPSSSYYFDPSKQKYKYRSYSPNPVREMTTNNFMGVYVALKYRLYNKEKINFWYRENSQYNN